MIVPADLPGLDLAGLSLQVPLRERDLLVLASHDCDICHDSFEEEPDVELLVVRHMPSGSEDGNYSHGKNPRRFQFWISHADDRLLYEASMLERRWISRRLLAETEHRGRDLLDDETIRLLQRWLSRRYKRMALPSEFNRRAEPAREYLVQKLKTKHKAITGIYLLLDPREELMEGDTYSVLPILTARSETLAQDDQHRAAVQVKSLVQEAFARCDGLELQDVRLVSEAEVSLEDVRNLVPWDYSDHLSYRQGTPDDVAPR